MFCNPRKSYGFLLSFAHRIRRVTQCCCRNSMPSLPCWPEVNNKWKTIAYDVNRGGKRPPPAANTKGGEPEGGDKDLYPLKPPFKIMKLKRGGSLLNCHTPLLITNKVISKDQYTFLHKIVKKRPRSDLKHRNHELCRMAYKVGGVVSSSTLGLSKMFFHLQTIEI